MLNGFITQMLWGTIVTLELAFCALFLGLFVGLLGALLESIQTKWLRYVAASFIFIVRGLPELLVLFFIYFGLTAGLTQLFNHYVEVSSFAAGVIALGLIFGAYASQVFRGAFMTLDHGQIEAGKVLGLSRAQIFFRIQLPQAWRHALPGLSNLWLILLKDTAIVTLIGLNDMMNEAKLAATTNHQPFTYYLLAAFIYLIITTASQAALNVMVQRANRYV